MVKKALAGTNNKLAPGPDGIGYRLIKLVQGTKLGQEVISEVASNLRQGRIKEFERLQYHALKKCINATHGSSMELVSRIAGVESPRMALDTGDGQNNAGSHGAWGPDIL